MDFWYYGNVRFSDFWVRQVFGSGTRGKTGLWATVRVSGEGREQGATNVAFSPPLKGTVMGEGGRNVKYVAIFLIFPVYWRKNYETVSIVWPRAAPR